MFQISKSWHQLLQSELESEEFKNLQAFLNKEYSSYTIYPKPENVFAAINLVSYKNVKVVIIGQDPYHGPKQAHGLSFSVEGDVAFPPSLQNIFKEAVNDCGITYPTTGNLHCWARQGVLMLNTVLTVRAGSPNSHKGKGWELITKRIIELLNQREEPVVFMLWGGNAKSFLKLIDQSKHHVLQAAHPSPLSANVGGWFGCKHFSKCNEILTKLRKDTIDWQVKECK